MDVAVELKLLGAAIVVGLVQLLWAAAAARAQQDLKWARLDRAFWNFAETFPFFAAAVLACAVAGKLGTPLTVWGAGLYVAARPLCAALRLRHPDGADAGVVRLFGGSGHGDRGPVRVSGCATADA